MQKWTQQPMRSKIMKMAAASRSEWRALVKPRGNQVSAYAHEEALLKSEILE